MENELLQQILDELKNTNSRLDKLEQGQAKLEQGQAKLEQGQAELKAEVAEVKSDVKKIKSELGYVWEDIKKLDERTYELRRIK